MAFAAPVAELPEIKKPIDKRLYLGTPDEITQYVGHKRQAIDAIIAALNQIIKQDKNKERINQATSVKDLFLGLRLQYKILLSELKRNSPTIPSRPKISGSPYKVDDFDRIIAYQQEINSQLSGTDKQYSFLQNRLETLKDVAVDRLADYSELLKTRPEQKLKLYEKYCKLLNLQNEYAILRLRKPRLEKLATALVQEQEFAAELVTRIFTHLQISPKDIDKARDNNRKLEESLQKLSRRNSQQYQELSRQILVYEARLNQLIAKLKQNPQGFSSKDAALIEKERLELINNALQLRLHLLEQEKKNLKIKRQRAAFRVQWLKSHTQQENGTDLSGFIKNWEKIVNRLNQELEETTTAISETSLARTNLTQKLATIRNRIKKASTDQIKNALRALSRQADKTIDNLDKLSLLLTDNDHQFRNIIREINQVLALTRSTISRKARFRVWSQLRYEDFRHKVLQVLYYPLFSFGTSAINLYIILKIILLFFFGLAVLRFIRRKIEHLLAKRVGMSPGAINSITTLGYYASILICTMLILSLAGLDLSQLSIILGALGVGIGFGLQTITNNFISGIILLSEQSVKVGDYITLADGVVGEVRKMAIRSTVIRTADGEDIIVPNSDLISNQVRTWSYGDDDWRRLDIPFGVTYDADPDEVARLAEKAAREVNITREDYRHKISVFFEGFGDNSLDFSIRVWCRMTNLKAPAGLKTDYYFALFRKLKAAGIEIPYPQRDLHLRSLSPELKKEFKEWNLESRDDSGTNEKISK
jgi:small-conductance mechanosensitive channel